VVLCPQEDAGQPHIPCFATIEPKVEGAGGSWHGRFESKGWYYDYKNKVYVHRTQGSELHVGSGKEKKVYRSKTATISVEATSAGGSREIPAETDLGEYFEKQRRSAELEATEWMALFIGGSVATIAIGALGGFTAAWDYVTFYTARRIAGHYVTEHAISEMELYRIGPATIGRVIRGGARYIDVARGSTAYVRGSVGRRIAAITYRDPCRIVTAYRETAHGGQFLKPGRWFLIGD
jgi:hypothetical protein